MAFLPKKFISKDEPIIVEWEKYQAQRKVDKTECTENELWESFYGGWSAAHCQYGVVDGVFRRL